MDWQPIETAPRDGTWILLRGGTSKYGWYGDNFPPMVCAQFDCSSWQFAYYESGYYGEYKNPTHWMPLPAPPKDRQP